MRDLRGEPDDVVARERGRVAAEGWGSRLLDRQRPDGKWGDGIAAPHWQSTLCTLVLLRDMGLDPTSERARRAVGLVREQVTWGPEFGDSPFFEGEVEPCINGRVLALGAYFGQASGRLLDRLLGEQLADGGWNCEAERGSVRSSFHTTICVLEGLLAYEKTRGAMAPVTDARVRAQEYLLTRRMFRRRSTGEVVRDRKGNHDWTRFAFPPTWHYDVLRGLDYLRAAGVEPDERVAEAVGLVTSSRNQDGRWTLHEHHPDPVQLDMEGGAGKPSRWNTLRALRVLDWYSAGENMSTSQAKAPESGHAPVNGINMYYEVHGRRDGVPLVLLHGGGSTIEVTFGRALPVLARSRRVIALEEQGHGRTSDREAPVTFESSADDVAAFLRYLKVDRADILGFSNGASVALQVAIRHPQLVRKLVFASSITKRSGAQPQLWEFMEQADFSNMPQALKDAFLRVNPDARQLKTMHDKDAARMQNFKDVPDDMVRSVSAPTLIVLGDRDIVKLEHAVELTRLISGARLLVLPGGHGDYLGEVVMTQTDTRYPELTARLIEEFLDSRQ